MSLDERYKNYLKEVELSPKDKALVRILKEVSDHPAVLSHVEPPAGYEDKLIHALRAQLPQPAAPLELPKRVAARSTVFWKTPQFSWSLTGLMAIFLLVFLTIPESLKAPNESSGETDLLAQTAEKGGEVVVKRWLASMGDSAVRVAAAGNIDSLANDLGSSGDQRLVNKALDDVAKSMGMKF